VRKNTIIQKTSFVDDTTIISKKGGENTLPECCQSVADAGMIKQQWYTKKIVFDKGFSGHLENGCDTPFVPSDDNLWGLKSIMFYIYMLYVSVYLF